MTGLYVGYVTVAGEAAFEPLSVWLQLRLDEAEVASSTLLRGVSALLRWCNQERAPDGGYFKIARTPRGLVAVREDPLDHGYWIAPLESPDETEIDAHAKKLTRWDHVRTPSRPTVVADTFEQLAAALGETDLVTPCP